MPKDKNSLLEEINSIIKENLSRISSTEEESSVIIEKDSSLFSQKLGSIRQFMPLSKILQTIARLEQRIDALEKQNDNLLYFIHFIYENFSQLSSSSLTQLPAEINKKRKSVKEQQTGGEADTPALTHREAEVLSFLVKGLCVKEIATKLFISQNTVITHKKNLKEKFKARTTVEMISKAFQLS